MVQGEVNLSHRKPQRHKFQPAHSDFCPDASADSCPVTTLSLDLLVGAGCSWRQGPGMMPKWGLLAPRSMCRAEAGMEPEPGRPKEQGRAGVSLVCVYSTEMKANF